MLEALVDLDEVIKLKKTKFSSGPQGLQACHARAIFIWSQRVGGHSQEQQIWQQKAMVLQQSGEVNSFMDGLKDGFQDESCPSLSKEHM